MKLIHLTIAAAAVTVMGGAAYAQQPQPAAAPTPGSVTGDWNGAHAPPDDKQYQDKVTVPLGSAPPTSATSSTSYSSSASTDVTAPPAAPAATSYAQGASYTATTLTNGPIPDTPQNRKKYGQPLSNAGKRTAARGN
jgi:hypothetical protein